MEEVSCSVLNHRYQLELHINQQYPDPETDFKEFVTSILSIAIPSLNVN